MLVASKKLHSIITSTSVVTNFKMMWTNELEKHTHTHKKNNPAIIVVAYDIEIRLCTMP